MQGQAKGDGKKEYSNEPERVALQKDADKIWLKSPDYLSKSAVAREIVKMYGLTKRQVQGISKKLAPSSGCAELKRAAKTQ